MGVFTTKQIEDYLKEINKDDLVKMFNSSLSVYIKNKPQEEIEDKLLKYFEYDVPVSLGDIVEIYGSTYVVTCIYTDNSVDLLNNEAKKVNKGLYNIPFTKVGELDCIVL